MMNCQIFEGLHQNKHFGQLTDLLLYRYHFSHFGKLTGLSSFLSALFILVQDPLFVLVNSSLGGDPFWVSVAKWPCIHACQTVTFATRKIERF